MRSKPILAALLAAALVVTACGGRSGSSGGRGEAQQGGTAAQISGDFGDLKAVCQPGKASSSPAQGVTGSEIQVGVLSDIGFTKKTEYIDAAKAFTGWCNDAGGINGRKLVGNTRDTQMVQVRQAVQASCKQDFALVGGSASLDGLATKDRLSCLLPAWPAQVVQNAAISSDLQLDPTGGHDWGRYPGLAKWLTKEKYPASAGAVGVITADSPASKPIAAQVSETFQSVGATVSYNDLYPSQGVSDWTPYAQAIKNKGVRGLEWLGDLTSLAKLEQVLTNIGYKLDWIDTNSNTYGSQFVELAGPAALSQQNNYADISGVYPVEKAADNPATKQVVDLFAKYAPGAKVTLAAVRSFAAWVLFAKSAATCGDNLTRKCAYEASRKESAWTAGGLIAPVDLSQPNAPLKCFNVVHATPNGWEPADFKPDTAGAYRCDMQPYRYTGTYDKALTLADAGKSEADFK